MGRTKEERALKILAIKQAKAKAKHDMLVDKSIVKNDVDPKETELAQIRAKLGYKNPDEPVEEQIKWHLLHEDFVNPVVNI